MACSGAILLTLVLGVAAPFRAAASPESLEQQILALVNSGRPTPLVMHAGLRHQARIHSQAMDRAGGLNHDGAAARFERASPDPAESNGPPDDGFTPIWCENVAWVGGGAESEAAQRVYDGWFNSPPHLACMTNPAPTAAGVGVYFEGGEWWVTLEAAQDLTPPGGRPAVSTPKPKPPDRTESPPTAAPTEGASRRARPQVAAAVVTPTPTPPERAPDIASLAVPRVRPSRDTASTEAGFGAIEIAAVVSFAGAALTSELARRGRLFRRRFSEL